MSSSIFSSENLRAYWRLPATEQGAHLGIVVLLGVVLFLCHGLAAAVDRALLPYGRMATFAMARASLSETTEILIAGSSHVFLGIDPQQLSMQATNVAAPAWDYMAIEAAVRKNLRRAPNLRLALIEFDPLPLRIDSSKMLRGECKSLRVWGLTPEDVPCEDLQLESGALGPVASVLVPGSRVTPNAVWETVGVRFVGSPELRKPMAGHRTYDAVGQAPGHGLQRVRWIRGKFSPADGRRNRAALGRMVNLLVARGVPVVLVTLPHHSGFSDNVPPAWRAQQRELLHWLREESGRQLQLWDFESSPEFRQQDFMDSVHLNRSGSMKFTRRLDKRLRQYLG